MRLLDSQATWKGKVAALVGVLVMVPSLINAGHDIIVAWRGLPISEKEKTNVRLFKAHFKEPPLLTKQIIIEGTIGKVPLTLDVYKNGDIFVDYGQFIQWFPYAVPNTYRPAVAFMAVTFAEPIIERHSVGESVSVEDQTSNEKGTVVRVREYEDGTQERKVINVNTGEVKEIEIIDIEKEGVSVETDSNSMDTEVIVLPDNP